MKLIGYGLLCFLALIIAPGLGLAQDDAEGSKDHPLLSRLPAYHIADYEEKEFDAYEFPLRDEKTQTVEGRKTVIQYQPREGALVASGLQIRRNYSNAVTKLGGRVVFEDEGSIVLTATTKAGREVWVHVENTGVGDGTGGYRLTIIEKEAMVQAVVANDMLAALNQAGRIALYINFDTGKATIKPESQAVVAQIVTLLKENPDLTLAIEGHTDNVGDAKSNQTLSEQRAQAVRAALIQQGIAASRLTAVGFGQTKPVADNNSDEGRAKNRRVELVKK